MWLAASVLLVVPSLVGPGAQPAGAAATCPDAGACLVVRLEGSQQGTRVVSADEIAAWQDQGNDLSYPVRSRAGGPTNDQAAPGALSLRQLVVRLGAQADGPFSGLSPDAVTLVKIPDPRSGYVLTMPGRSLAPAGSNGYAGGLVPAVYRPTGNGTLGFVRPLTDDPDDVNVQDSMQTNQGGALEITLNTQGSVLRPRISASSTQTDADAPVSFSVDFSSPPSTALTYAWSFGDGTTGDQPAPSHAWSAAGTYYVSLTVQGADGSYGQSNAVLVTVGAKQPTGGGSTPGTGASPNAGGPANGPNQGNGNGGGQNGGGQNGGNGGGSLAPSGAADPTPTAGATPGATPTAGAGTPLPTGPPTPVTPVTPSGFVAPTPSAAPTDRACEEPSDEPSDPVTPTAPGPGEIQGVLLSAAEVPAGSAGTTTSSDVPPAAAAARQGADAPVDPLVWWGASLPLLLLAGAASEGRWLRRALHRFGKER